MGPVGWWLCLCTLEILAVPCWGISLDKLTINVILLNDEESPWSLKFVEKEIAKAVEKVSTMNDGKIIKFK